MNTTSEQIAELVFLATDELNEELPREKALLKHRDTVIFGRDANIDSMTLVSLILAVEEQLLDTHDLSVTIANEKAMSLEHSPFRTLGSLIDYVHELVETDHHG